MRCFLRIGTRHDCKINCTAQIDKVNIRLILNLHSLGLLILFALGAFILLLIVALVVASLAENLSLEPLVSLFVLLPIGIVLEDVQTVLDINFAVELDLVRNLILLLNKIQLLLHRRIILEPVFAHLKQHLNHVLRTLINIGFVQNISELIKDDGRNRRPHLLEKLSNLSAEPNRNLHTIIRRFIEQQQQNLPSQHLMLHLLIDQVRQERRRRQADRLVIPLESFAELHNQALDKQLTNLRQLSIHNSRHGRINRRKRQTRSLRLHNRPAKQTPSANQILAKQLRNNVLDVRRVDFIDETVDTLLQSLPRHALVLLARLVGNLRLQSPQPRGRDIRASGSHIDHLFVFCLGRGLLLVLCRRGRGRSRARPRRTVGIAAIARAVAARDSHYIGRRHVFFFLFPLPQLCAKV